MSDPRAYNVLFDGPCRRCGGDGVVLYLHDEKKLFCKCQDCDYETPKRDVESLDMARDLVGKWIFGCLTAQMES